jgi:hypothetical protein
MYVGPGWPLESLSAGVVTTTALYPKDLIRATSTVQASYAEIASKDG